jgi:hypothetical protein
MIKKIFFLCLFISPIMSMQRYFIIHDYIGLQKDTDAQCPVSPKATKPLLDEEWVNYHQPKKCDRDMIQVDKTKLIAILTDIKK